MYLARVSRSDALAVYPRTMLYSARSLIAVVSLSLAACGGPQRGGGIGALAPHCDVTHNLHNEDEVQGRIDRVQDGWVLTLRMRVHLGEGHPEPVELAGQGRVTRAGNELRCQVLESTTAEGQAHFDEALCLDEFESLAALLQDAEAAARPGETVVQEVSLRRTRRRSRRSRVGVRVVSFQERAEVTRDVEGRVIRLVRNAEGGGREEISVNYPSGVRGRCIPSTGE